MYRRINQISYSIQRDTGHNIIVIIDILISEMKTTIHIIFVANVLKIISYTYTNN